MIYGRVVDPQNAAVAAASVTVTNTGTNVSANLRSNETGYYEASLLLPGPYQVTVDANTDGFERSAARGPAAFHRRVFPTRIDGLRADMTKQWNASLLREFRIRETVAFRVRFDAINLQNRSQFNAPEVNPVSTNFGRITTQSAALNRLLQIHGRLQW